MWDTPVKHVTVMIIQVYNSELHRIALVSLTHPCQQTLRPRDKQVRQQDTNSP